MSCWSALFAGYIERESLDNCVEYLLVLSYAPNGALQDYLRTNVLDWPTFCKMSLSVARGLAHLHTDVRKGGEWNYMCQLHIPMPDSGDCLDKCLFCFQIRWNHALLIGTWILVTSSWRQTCPAAFVTWDLLWRSPVPNTSTMGRSNMQRPSPSMMWVVLKFYTEFISQVALFLLGLVFSSEGGGSVFLQNISGLRPDYAVLALKVVLFIVTAVQTPDPLWKSWNCIWELSKLGSKWHEWGGVQGWAFVNMRTKSWVAEKPEFFFSWLIVNLLGQIQCHKAILVCGHWIGEERKTVYMRNVRIYWILNRIWMFCADFLEEVRRFKYFDSWNVGWPQLRGSEGAGSLWSWKWRDRSKREIIEKNEHIRRLRFLEERTAKV